MRRKLKSCNSTAPALVKLKQKKIKNGLTNVLAFDMPDTLAARFATVDYILVITSCVDVVHLG